MVALTLCRLARSNRHNTVLICWALRHVTIATPILVPPPLITHSLMHNLQQRRSRIKDHLYPCRAGTSKHSQYNICQSTTVHFHRLNTLRIYLTNTLGIDTTKRIMISENY
ncbi:hypothetical protein GGR57DRAFT_272600 [Xylariaceae sp. FL1272]|nr:hypothetical protein GGR57DRAFT_272600 [Xylariaceae sp. FL1272]